MAIDPPRPDPPAVSATRLELPELSTLLTIVVVVVTVAALDLAREVLIPITLSVLLSFLLAPVVNLLRRLHVPRVPAVLLAVLLALAVILALGAALGTQVASLSNEVPRYQHTIEQKIQQLRDMTVGRLSSITHGLGHLETATVPVQPAQPAQPAAPNPQGSASGQTPPAGLQPGAAAPIPVEVHQPDPTPLDLAERVLEQVVGPLGTTAIVFIVAIFILLQREDLRDRMIRLFGSGDLHRTTVAMNDAAHRLSRYFLAQFAINAGYGVVVGGGLMVIGVPSAPLWGILSMLLRFLPYLGAPLAALLPVALAAAVDPGWTMALWTVGLFVAVEAIAGQVVEPLLYSHSTGLSPVSVVVSATFWTWLWGPIGLILSTPLTLCLVVLGRHVQRLSFLEVLLGDRPPLTAVESFYQRMLAGDPDEAYEQAETLLKERSLCSYYDDVAMTGLQAAAADRLSGSLADPQFDRLQRAFATLVEQLDDHEDIEPAHPAAPDTLDPNPADAPALPRPAPTAQAPEPAVLPNPWADEGAVLCVAGRGPLDAAAAAVLAQLLGKHGLGAQVLQHAEVAPARLAEHDLSQVAMICVCYLELSGTPSHARYLVRRLRQRRPGVPILVGLWLAGEDTLAAAERQRLLGADHYVGSLHDAIEACVGASQEAATQAPAALVA